MNWNPPAAAFLCGLVVKFDRGADLTRRAEHHVPGQARDLTRAQPGFDDNKTRIRFRSGYLVAPTYVRRYLKCLSDRILACLPAMAAELKFAKRSHNIVQTAVAQFELFDYKHNMASRGSVCRRNSQTPGIVER
jgi:hypothetical protein